MARLTGDQLHHLSTIKEDDELSRSNSMRSLGSSNRSLGEAENGAVTPASSAEDDAPPPPPTDAIAAKVEANGADQEKKEKKKKKKSKVKDGYFSAEGVDAAQQILVDLCNEMKELKTSMQQEAEKTNSAMTDSLSSNSEVMKSLSEQMAVIEGNMRQLDQVIESKATPEQIEELARIRAVQEMLRVAAEDKDKTIEIYEKHARRGYEEIERLRRDLEHERKETATLRNEVEILRAQKIDMIRNSAANGERRSTTSGAPNRVSGGSMMSFDDDMTLETKGSYDTAAYEMKSLKKRVIHMKKKLAVAQVEAKEADTLRAEVERLRQQHETEKKQMLEKDETIKKLQTELNQLKIKVATASTHPVTKQHSKKGSKWWQQL